MKDRIVTVAGSGEGAYGQVITAGHHTLTADEPVSLGGKDSGPDPFELVLAGLGACTAMTLRLYADRHKWPLDQVEVTLRHARAASHQTGVKDLFERTIILKGNLDDEQKRKLVEIAGRCPVSLTLAQGVEMQTVMA